MNLMLSRKGGFLMWILLTVYGGSAVCYLLISPGIVRFFVLCSLSVLSSIAAIYFVGCNRDDRAMVVKMVEGVISKLRRR